MKRIHLGSLLLAGALAANVQAASVSLTNDFSLTNGNPNGDWVYLDGTTLLSVQIPVNNGNAVRPALANGYWGLGNDLNTNTPDFGKTQVNGSAAGETDADFLAGDIIAHTPNNGSSLFVNWTAPSDGAISNLALLVWYAHSSAGFRSNDYTLRDNSTVLTSGTISSTSFGDRNHAASFADAGFNVSAGDVISFGLAKTPQQTVGSLDGISLDFSFVSNTPEPATLGFMAVGVAALAVLRRKRIVRN